MFAGITFLAHQFGTFPMEASDPATKRSSPRSPAASSAARTPPTTTSRSRRWLILVLAANTAFSDFPRLAYFLARDRYMPRQFTFRATGWPTRPASSRSACWPGIVLLIFDGEVEH